MDKIDKEQVEAMRRFARNDVMQHYAEGFGKGLNIITERSILREREPTGMTCSTYQRKLEGQK